MTEFAVFESSLKTKVVFLKESYEMMSSSNQAKEPSMDEILDSIRRIISDETPEEELNTHVEQTPASQPAPAPAPSQPPQMTPPPSFAMPTEQQGVSTPSPMEDVPADVPADLSAHEAPSSVAPPSFLQENPLPAPEDQPVFDQLASEDVPDYRETEPVADPVPGHGAPRSLQESLQVLETQGQGHEHGALGQQTHNDQAVSSPFGHFEATNAFPAPSDSSAEIPAETSVIPESVSLQTPENATGEQAVNLPEQIEDVSLPDVRSAIVQMAEESARVEPAMREQADASPVGSFNPLPVEEKQIEEEQVKPSGDASDTQSVLDVLAQISSGIPAASTNADRATAPAGQENSKAAVSSAASSPAKSGFTRQPVLQEKTPKAEKESHLPADEDSVLSSASLLSTSSSPVSPESGPALDKQETQQHGDPLTMNAQDKKPETETSRSMEAVVKEMLGPLIKEWLDDNMPRILEEAMREELAKAFEKK